MTNCLPMRGAVASGLIAWGVLTGCSPAPTPKPVRERVPARESTGLQAEIDRVPALPWEPGGLMTAWGTSTPAATRPDWVLQTLLHGYRETGAGDPAWDREVQDAFRAFADHGWGTNTSHSVYLEALRSAAVTPCTDPMLRYLVASQHIGIRTRDEAATSMLQAHAALIQSGYHPFFRFHAGMQAIDAARGLDEESDRGRRISWTVTHMKNLAEDVHAPADDVFECVANLIEHSPTRAWVDYVSGHVNPILQRNWGEGERWIRYQGREEICRAWADRGGDWARTVTAAGWRGFREHLVKAEGFLTRAWQMNSNSVETALMMMTVELGQGKGRDREEQWFRTVMALDPNNYDAASKMSYYLEPRWHGSEEEALEFGRSCVASEVWGGRVPLVLPKTHRSLARYHELRDTPGDWGRPEVWRDIQFAYEKFFQLNPEDHGLRHDYARDAYRCGQHEAFLEQTKLFVDGTNYVFFGGEEDFKEMIAESQAAIRGETNTAARTP